MTKAAQHFGKRLDHFWEAQETREYVVALSLQLTEHPLFSSDALQDPQVQKRLTWFRGLADAKVGAHAYPYSTGWNAFKRLAAQASPDVRAALFGGTASRVYRLS